MASIFTKIIKKELPSYLLFENDYVISILAREQINPGHALVIPKAEIDHFFDVPSPYLEECARVNAMIAKIIKQEFKCVRVGLCAQGFEVHHCHYHLIPLNDPSELDFRRAKKLGEDEMIVIQNKIKAHL